MSATHARFLSCHRKKAFDQVRIKSRSQSNRLRKAGRVEGRMTVQAFFVKDNRDSQPALFQKELLNGIGELGSSARVSASRSVAGPSHLTQAMSFLEMLAR